MRLYGSFGYLTILFLVSCLSNSIEAQEGQDAKEEFLELLREVHRFIDSDEYKLLDDAARLIISPYPFSTNLKPHLTVKEALASKLLAFYRAQPSKLFKPKPKFERVYDEKVTNPCKTVKRLNDKYQSLIESQPESSGWEASFGALSRTWTKSVDICRQERIKSVLHEFNLLKKRH